MKGRSLITIAAATVVVGAVIGFVGGIQYQKTQMTGADYRTIAGNRSNAGNGRGQFNRNGANAVRGNITSIDNGNLTVGLEDGSSKIVILGSGVRIEQTQEASSAALKTGEPVLILGTINSDGSLTAQMVQINPPMGRPVSGQ